MKWSRLSRTVPWHPRDTASLYSISTVIAESKLTGALVLIRQPGVHSAETSQFAAGQLVPRPGGDFVIEVKDPIARWGARQFRHIDLFRDFEDRGDQFRRLVGAL